MSDPATSTTPAPLPTTRSVDYIDLNDTKDNLEDDRTKIIKDQNQTDSLPRVNTTSVLQTSSSLHSQSISKQLSQNFRTL
jgi:hypothetical protein